MDLGNREITCLRIAILATEWNKKTLKLLILLFNRSHYPKTSHRASSIHDKGVQWKPLCEWCQCSEPGMHDQVTRKLINELPEATWSSLESYGNHIVHSLFVEFNVSFVDCGCKNWILPSLGAACVQARHWPPDIHWKIEREAARMGWMNEPTFAQMQYATISILAKFGFEFWMFWACNSSNLALRQVQEISYFGNYKYSFSNCETDRNSSWTNVQKQRKLKSKKCEASEMLCVDALRKTWTKQWIRKARDTTSRLWTLTLELEG